MYENVSKNESENIESFLYMGQVLFFQGNAARMRVFFNIITFTILGGN